MTWANPLVIVWTLYGWFTLESPYPGLQEFLKVRSLRDYHMDDCTDIDLQYL